ncbi:unnamed protein product, partial [marine sediment metagenome]
QMILLKRQRNQVFDLIRSVGLEPYNFQWSTVKSEESIGLKVSQLNYRDSEYFFKFDFYEYSSYWIVFSPGSGRPVEKNLVAPEWESIPPYVSQWLAELKREVEEPDLWAHISEYRLPEGATPRDDTSNKPFAAFEVEQIEKSIREIGIFLREHYGESEGIEGKLDYLIEASKRMGRKDWLNICIGTLVTLGVTQAIQGEHIQHVWNLIRAALKGVVYFLQ